MLTREEQNEILSLTRELLPSVLEEINFDPNDGKKEKGHRSGEDLETTFVREFIERDNIRFTEPTADRAMADFLFNGNKVNIKFSCVKGGQPNMCAWDRLYLGINEEEIDSYWILMINGLTQDVCLFNLYEHLDYTNTDLGTGQTMLKKTKFLKYFNQDKDYTIHNKNDILNKLDWIDEDAWERMLKAKSKKINNRRRIRNDRN